MPVKVGLGFCSKIAACGLVLASLLPVSVQAQTLSWRQQLGTPLYEASSGVATDSKGNVYISGRTRGALAGTNNAGEDAFVAKFNSSSKLLWKQQLGLFGPSVISNDVATDSNGNVYITGFTDGSLAGDIQGMYEAFVAKYNSSGNLVWKRQLQSSSNNDTEISQSVATDSNGNVYISGYTDGSFAGASKGRKDAWVAKYSNSGERMWKRQLGSSEDDYSYSVATDSSGNIYISGGTDGDLAEGSKGLDDAWVAKYNSSGTLVWKRQLGTSEDDESYAVATDSNGNVYITGFTIGSLAGPNNAGADTFVAKYNPSGTLVWKQQLGLFGPGVFPSGVATDSNGNIYIAGGTHGSLVGSEQVLNDDFVAKYNTSGTLVWKQQYETPDIYDSHGFSSVAIDSIANVYITGVSEGTGNPNDTGDAFLIKYTQ